MAEYLANPGGEMPKVGNHLGLAGNAMRYFANRYADAISSTGDEPEQYQSGVNLSSGLVDDEHIDRFLSMLDRLAKNVTPDRG